MEGGPWGRPFRIRSRAMAPENQSYDRSPPSALSVGLRGRCPRCGRGRLFDGYLATRPACESCGLDFRFIDSGDGPAFFVMSFVGIVVVALALWMEFTFQPRLWIIMAVTIPVTLLLSFGLVRPAKGLLIALQYQNKAEEGRIRR
jgi:uncharacterized protein (DUF983 family)